MTSVAFASQPVNTSQISVPEVPLDTALKVQIPHKPNFDTDVLAPLQVAQAAKKAADEAAAQQKAADDALEAARQAEIVQPVQVAYSAPGAFGGSLIGQIGYASPFGNCVDEPGLNNPGWGNPIDWPVTSFTPWIGATALFSYNHVGLVVGMWSNGDLEIAHENFQGGQHRFSRYEFRGFR